MVSYKTFLKRKQLKDRMDGFEPLWIPDFLFDFQKDVTIKAIRKGRFSLFEDCGLGKTPQQLVWAENIHRKTNKKVLIFTPLAVSRQTIREGIKFGIEVRQTQTGKIRNGLNITNYERIDNYNPDDFGGIVLDESSILKSFDGKTRQKLTAFAENIDYILLCSATPAPNDYIELGTSSEILGNMTRNQMLGMFFRHEGTTTEWSLKGHGRTRFWEWVSTWAVTIRKPSDLGYEDNDFILPKLNIISHIVKSKVKKGHLLPVTAIGLNEQRQARKETLELRCYKVKESMPDNKVCLLWCNYNNESSLLKKIIPDAVEVKGSDSDKIKEQRLTDFTDGKIRALVTKPSIAGWGLNWQHCHNMSFFPSHSYEQYYQAVRRCWRFGQKKKVDCHLVSSQSEGRVLNNMLRKERNSGEMFNSIIKEMKQFQNKEKPIEISNKEMRLPSWL